MLFDSLLSPLTVKHLGRCVYCKAHDQTVKLYGVDALYTARIKEVVNLYAQCDKILRQLTTTRIKAPTFILLSDKNGNGRLAQTSSARRNLLVFPQTFANQSSYHSYSLSTKENKKLLSQLECYDSVLSTRLSLFERKY